MEDIAMSVFTGRSLTVVKDLSVDEQIYLYEKAHILKEKILSGKTADEFRIDDPDLGVYLFFMEDSTRTKESFRNACHFHTVKLNDFDAKNSSFNKKESITDTVKMLTGYSACSIFVIRSKQEGLCRWLDEAIGNYAEKVGLPKPSFINAGDGRHEHPTQEFLDEFSFLEQKRWNRDSLHIALVGDLYHGRTVHSKVEGLRIFKKVRVDLIAPDELALQPHYVEAMKQNGYETYSYPSIKAYLDAKEVADTWYFTRLQLERMGDKVLDKADTLCRSVTFQKDFIDRVSKNVRFYHPLPQDSSNPTLPKFLESTCLNNWDMQSINGYYTRIIEVAMLGGKLGDDFKGTSVTHPEYPDDYVIEVPPASSKHHDYKVGIKPVENGIVIDHISKSESVEKIWVHIDKIRRILNLNTVSSHGVFKSKQSDLYKGIISLPDISEFSSNKLKMLGAIAPGCTLNIINDSNVLKKYRMKMPPRIYNFKEISCKNEDCVSNQKYYENVTQEFSRSKENAFVCKYCEKPHAFEQIW
jgi:aspartate carbamoyltransferase